MGVGVNAKLVQLWDSILLDGLVVSHAFTWYILHDGRG
jgi:hypothetical protein